MSTLSGLLIVVQRTLFEWWGVRWGDLRFAEADAALSLMIALLAISAMALLTRRLWRRKAGRTHVPLPALLPVIHQSRLSASRHAAFLIFLLGVPFFAVALAAPQTAFTRDEVSYPGRRIAIGIDSSNSMVMTFRSEKLNTVTSAYFTAAAAADYFVRLRMKGPYRDLIALLQFGKSAYLVTPFTTDYENILISIKLVSDPKEWRRNSENGTTIIGSIEQGLALFEAFDFLNVSGNLMLIFTDGGESNEAALQGQYLRDLTARAAESKVPIFMIRMGNNKKLGEAKEDQFWKPAVEASGGRFYAAANEDDLLNALADIDRLSPGQVELREYTSQRPRFSGYALIAVVLWMLAATLKLGVPYFRTFP